MAWCGVDAASRHLLIGFETLLTVWFVFAEFVDFFGVNDFVVEQSGVKWRI